MKKTAIIVLVLACFSLSLAGAVSARTETATGKVTAVDPDGKAIVVVKGAGYHALNRGAVVNQDTVVIVKGKKAALGSIKVGDKVTMKLERSDNLYAKKIVKK